MKNSWEFRLLISDAYIQMFSLKIHTPLSLALKQGIYDQEELPNLLTELNALRSLPDT